MLSTILYYFQEFLVQMRNPFIFSFIFLLLLSFIFSISSFPVSLDKETLPVKSIKNLQTEFIKENTNIYFISTKDGYLHALNNEKKELWKVYLEQELMSSTFSRKINKDLYLLPINKGLYINNNGEYTPFPKFIKFLAEKKYYNAKDFSLLGKTKTTLFIIDVDTGKILQKIDDDNNFSFKKRYVLTKNRNTITVARIDYILNCLNIEEEQNYWSSSYSDIIIHNGNENYDSDSMKIFSPNLQEIINDYKSNNINSNNDISLDNVITAYSYFNKDVSLVKIYDLSYNNNELEGEMQKLVEYNKNKNNISGENDNNNNELEAKLKYLENLNKDSSKIQINEQLQLPNYSENEKNNFNNNNNNDNDKKNDKDKEKIIINTLYNFIKHYIILILVGIILVLSFKLSYYKYIFKKFIKDNEKKGTILGKKEKQIEQKNINNIIIDNILNNCEINNENKDKNNEIHDKNLKKINKKLNSYNSMLLQHRSNLEDFNFKKYSSDVTQKKISGADDSDKQKINNKNIKENKEKENSFDNEKQKNNYDENNKIENKEDDENNNEIIISSNNNSQKVKGEKENSIINKESNGIWDDDEDDDNDDDNNNNNEDDQNKSEKNESNKDEKKQKIEKNEISQKISESTEKTQKSEKTIKSKNGIWDDDDDGEEDNEDEGEDKEEENQEDKEYNEKKENSNYKNKINKNSSSNIFNDISKSYERMGTKAETNPKYSNEIIENKKEKKLNRLDTDFENLEKIGEGGFGVVLKGRHKIDQDIYAIKIIDVTVSNKECDEIVSEAKKMNAIKGEYIVNYNICWYDDNLGTAEKFFEKQDKSDISSSNYSNLMQSKTITMQLTKKDSKYNNNNDSKGIFNIQELDEDKYDDNNCNNNNNINDNKDGKIINKESTEKICNNNNSVELLENKNKNQIYNNRSKYCFEYMDDSKLINKSILSRKYDEEINQKKQKKYFFILMEYCDGLTLEIFIVQHSNKSIERKIIYNYTRQILKALKKLHKNGIIHRDIKPGNIFIKHEQIKIGDFGLATQFQKNAKLQTKDLRGFTPTYAAPEQTNSLTYNEKVDIYACGITLFEMCACFGTEMERQLAVKDLKSKRIVLDRIIKDYPEESKLIKMMTERDYNERPSAEQILKSELFAELGKIVNK